MEKRRASRAQEPSVVPGETSAGRLVCEYRARLKKSTTPQTAAISIYESPDLIACRHALPSDEQAAYDAGCIHSAGECREDLEPAPLADRLLRDKDRSLEAKKMIAASCVRSLYDHLPGLAKAICHPDLPDELVILVAKWVNQTYLEKPAQAFLESLKERLSEAQLDLVKKAEPFDEQDPSWTQATLIEANELLGPEYLLLDDELDEEELYEEVELADKEEYLELQEALRVASQTVKTALDEMNELMTFQFKAPKGEGLPPVKTAKSFLTRAGMSAEKLERIGTAHLDKLGRALLKSKAASILELYPIFQKARIDVNDLKSLYEASTLAVKDGKKRG